jgi:hypothetical protein
MMLQVHRDVSPGKEVRAAKESRRRKLALAQQVSKTKKNQDTDKQTDHPGTTVIKPQPATVVLDGAHDGPDGLRVTARAAAPADTDSDDDADAGNSGIDPELWSKAVATALAFRAFRAGSRVSKRQRKRFAQALCGQWLAVGAGIGDNGEKIEELLLIDGNHLT